MVDRSAYSGSLRLGLSVCVVLAGAGTVQAGSQSDNRARGELSRWLARQELAPFLRGTVRARLTGSFAPTGGNRFLAEVIQTQIDTLRQDDELKDWTPSEAEQLVALRKATDELLQLLDEIGNIEQMRRGTRKKAPQSSLALPSNLPRDSALDSIAEVVRDIASWRQTLPVRARQALRPSSAETNVALENDMAQTWNDVLKKVNEDMDRLLPIMAADGHVRGYERDGLIQSCKRLELRVASGISLRETRDPQLVREVVYNVIDAYGQRRVGIVAVFSDARGMWRVSSENEANGGFYELSQAQ